MMMSDLTRKDAIARARSELPSAETTRLLTAGPPLLPVMMVSGDWQALERRRKFLTPDAQRKFLACSRT